MRYAIRQLMGMMNMTDDSARASNWSLVTLFEQFHQEVEWQLDRARRSIAHPGDKGDASESVWLDVFNTYLPRRYHAINGHVADSNNCFSHQVDVIIHDRQYSPLIFHFKDKTVVPAESVYAVFEAKQTIDATLIRYAKTKAKSVRKLHRTSRDVPHAGGITPARDPFPILAGVLSLESEWRPPLGPSLTNNLATDDPQERLDLGCAASKGYFHLKVDGEYETSEHPKATTRFLFELITRLQDRATVPMIDLMAYSKWLDPTYQATVTTERGKE
jgi:hypothetical protein